MTDEQQAEVRFDQNIFLSLDEREVYKFVSMVDRSGGIGIDETSIRSLFSQLESMPFMHAFYVFNWAAPFRLAGTSDAGISLLRRSVTEGHGEIPLLQLMLFADDFSAEHLRSIESMSLRDPWGGVALLLANLRTKVATPKQS
jgi:hypothetical protein